MEILRDLFEPGREAFELSMLEMALRALLVYLFAIGLIRLGSQRFMGRSTAFDLIVGIMLGSVLSRGITGQAPFFPVLAAGVVLVIAHWLTAFIAYHTSNVGSVVKGRHWLLVEDGKIQEKNVRRTLVSQRDIVEAIRASGAGDSIEDVKQACLERDGSISVIPRVRKAQVVEVDVKAGVQTVRVEIS